MQFLYRSVPWVILMEALPEIYLFPSTQTVPKTASGLRGE
jgi:hypothetical protein